MTDEPMKAVSAEEAERADSVVCFRGRGMTWKFDQAPNVACITCRSVIAGHPVLVATHYEDDHSWGFLDGAPLDMAEALVVAMSEIVNRHPDLDEIADLPPGWSAIRVAVSEPWIRQRSDWGPDE